MAQGKLYPVYLRIPLYANADNAKAKTNIASYITPDGSEVEGPGTFYTDTNYIPSSHAPARPLYFVHAQYGGGYLIGWVNDDENAAPTTPQASNGVMGSSLKISTPRVNASFKHTLKYSFGGSSGTIATGVDTSYTWTPPLTLANQVPNAIRGDLSIICETYAGTTLVGTKTITVYLYVPASIVPSIGSVTHSEAVAGIAAKFSGYVRYKSKIKIVTSASGSYGSTIKKIRVGVDNQVMEGATVTTPNFIQSQAGTFPTGMVVEVTDSRGRVTKKWYEYTVLEWYPPKPIQLSAIRTDASGSELPNGYNARIYYQYDIAPVSSSNDSNWAVDYSESGSSWTNLASGTGYTQNTNFISGAVFNPDKSYIIRLAVTDYFDTKYAYYTLPTSSSVLDFRHTKKGLAIGKASEKDAFEVAWPTEFLSTVMIGGQELSAILPMMMPKRINLTLINGASGVDDPHIVKMGPMVIFKGLIVAGVTATTHVVAILPAELRGSLSENTIAFDIDNRTVHRVLIGSTKGEMFIHNTTANARYKILPYGLGV